MRYTSRNVTDRFILDSFTIYKAFSNEIVVAISQLKTPPYQLSPPGLERWTSYCVRFQTSIAVNAANFLYPIHIITVDWLSSIVLCLWEGSYCMAVEFKKYRIRNVFILNNIRRVVHSIYTTVCQLYQYVLHGNSS